MAKQKQEHTCENCNLTFEIERHVKKAYQSGSRWIACGTGKNMAYRGDTDREYAVCPNPECGVMESQESAERRHMYQ